MFILNASIIQLVFTLSVACLSHTGGMETKVKTMLHLCDKQANQAGQIIIHSANYLLMSEKKYTTSVPVC